MVPGAAAAVGTAGGRLHAGWYGWAQLRPRRRRLTESMLFDLASLTKVVSTTTLTLQAIERGDLFLGQKVASVLPEFGRAGKDGVTVRQLLSHTSGLPAWRDVAHGGKSGEAALENVWRTPLERPGGTAVVYSDLGFITLGEAVCRLAGLPLPALLARDVLEPLGLRETHFSPGKALRTRCVTTEVMETRGGAITGDVHDDNAHALGGASGHAGLFSTLTDLERFCRMWLGGGVLEGRRVLSEASIDAATRDQTLGVDPLNRRGLGWVLQPNAFWPAADLVSPRACSHTGFTGTSMVLDPERGVYAILLTNRVHPSRADGSADRIRQVRARFHNAVWAALS
jgi:serine-type D-Ala-D-Ala carboxypeptidase